MKNQLVNEIDNLYLQNLCSCVTGYTPLATLTMLCHLYNLYAQLTPVKSDANNQAKKAPYDANLPFKNFVEQIEEAVIIGNIVGTPYSTRQIVTALYNVLHHTGVFKDKCKVWRKKAPLLCTWATMR